MITDSYQNDLVWYVKGTRSQYALLAIALEMGVCQRVGRAGAGNGDKDAAALDVYGPLARKKYIMNARPILACCNIHT